MEIFQNIDEKVQLLGGEKIGGFRHRRQLPVDLGRELGYAFADKPPKIKSLVLRLEL
jgi:hypothetical protein